MMRPLFASTTSGLSRHVPLIAFGALCLRLLACSSDSGTLPSGGDGGTSATGAGAGGGAGTTSAAGSNNGGTAGAACNTKLTIPGVTCVAATGKITYSAVDCDQLVSHDLTCNGPCEVVSTKSARCTNDHTIQTCVESGDCSTAATCVNKDAHVLADPICVDGICQWKGATTVSCTLGCTAGTCQGSGGTTSGSFPSGDPAACAGDTITYGFVQTGGGVGGPQVAQQVCKQACFTDVTGSGCVPVLGEPPFHTCEDNKCPKQATMCNADDPTHVTTFVMPQCGPGVCFWLGKTVTECPAGTTCKVDSCVP